MTRRPTEREDAPELRNEKERGRRGEKTLVSRVESVTAGCGGQSPRKLMASLGR